MRGSVYRSGCGSAPHIHVGEGPQGAQLLRQHLETVARQVKLAELHHLHVRNKLLRLPWQGQHVDARHWDRARIWTMPFAFTSHHLTSHPGSSSSRTYTPRGTYTRSVEVNHEGMPTIRLLNSELSITSSRPRHARFTEPLDRDPAMTAAKAAAPEGCAWVAGLPRGGITQESRSARSFYTHTPLYRCISLFHSHSTRWMTFAGCFLKP